MKDAATKRDRRTQKEPSQCAWEIAARIWCDLEMRNIAMDVEAVEAIAKIIDDVRHKSGGVQGRVGK